MRCTSCGSHGGESDGLCKKCRKLHISEFEDFDASLREVAKEMDISPEAVRKIQNRALGKIMVLMEPLK